MKCLIFSDSHGNREGIISALDRHKTAELVFFLGDGVREAEEIALCDTKRTWFFVLGNCDFKTDALGSKIKKTDEGITLIGLNPAFTPLFYSWREVAEKPVTVLGVVVELRAAI